MSISIGSMNDYYSNLTAQANANSAANRADKLKSATNGFSTNSTKEELTEAVKSFEQYFVEQMLKQFKESSKVFSSENSADSGLTDYYFDFAISDVARKMVDQYGERITEDFVAQVQRNYGITDAKEPEEIAETAAESGLVPGATETETNVYVSDFGNEDA